MSHRNRVWIIAPLVAVTTLVGCSGSPETKGGTPDSEDVGADEDPSAREDTVDVGDLDDGGTPDETDDSVGVCGNGELEPGEICDDGGTADGDGCSADCLTQDGDFDCSTPGEPCRDTVVCGNGVIEGDEACDDENEVGSDGCSADCSTIERGYTCPRPGVSCLSLPECGNGNRERGEACDDGNDSDPSDGCHECIQDDSFFCVAGAACVRLECGDGNRTPDERCDDGNTQGGDGCSAACEIETGFRCGSSGCVEDCGDGRRVGDELLGDGVFGNGPDGCDDGNRQSGDGCSAGCAVEPHFSCSGSPSSTCTSTIVCGNGVVEPGEVCETHTAGGAALNNGCRAGCQGFDVIGSSCGNGIVEPGESCEAPVSGCNGATCSPLDGYTCPTEDSCILLPYCGDGLVDPTEGCDDGNDNNSDGCGACVVDTGGGYVCAGSPSVCIREQCGDRTRTVSELCDDGNTDSGDGCDANCAVEADWICPVPGEACIGDCGDGIKLPSEECDDNNNVSGDGCNAACILEYGHTCPTPGAACVASECGNQIVESGEGCDFDVVPSNGPDWEPVGGDGCGPTCQNEPTVVRGPGQYPDPTLAAHCGDGLLDPDNNEDCDDGNEVDGDGCDEDCSIEPGWLCPQDLVLPPSVALSVTYRDFLNSSSTNGHPDFKPSGSSENEVGIVGPVCTASNNDKCTAGPGFDCPAGSCGMLDEDGKPVHHLSEANFDFNERGRITDAGSFGLWYRDSNPYSSWWDGTVTVNAKASSGGDVVQLQKVEDTLTLVQDAPLSERYTYSNDLFFPLTGQWPGSSAFSETLNDRDSNPQNFLFTTEIRYFFKYKGGESLEFTGDDDVWVFVNGRLAVEMGGLHKPEDGRVVLGDDGDGGADDSDCSVHGVENATFVDIDTCYETSERNSDTDERFGLEKGGIYEIVLFQAERSSPGSNFNLTLEGFLPPTSACEPDCGDGVLLGNEVCDDGTGGDIVAGTLGNGADGVAVEDLASGQCNSECTLRAYCGDGFIQPGEDCDDTQNQTLYSQTQSAACAPGCVAVPYCGDGLVEASEEFCDNGGSNSDLAYGPGACRSDCTPAPYCGDGTRDPGEACDRGVNNGVYNADSSQSCTTQCQLGPYCGDGERNGNETCDDGNQNNDDSCSNTCTANATCGNRIVEAPNDEGFNEMCDYGSLASSAYGSCTAECIWGPHCGDGVRDEEFEECDAGVVGNDGSYDGCLDSCVLGPRCGDGAVQSAEGESCDNGFNQDTYAFAEDSCGVNCTPVPFCGDGSVQSSFEYCDDGVDNAPSGGDTYDKCTSECTYGPYCGDGQLDAGHEGCDDGADNTAYSADGAACGYDCQPAAYCGDGQRNGPEQCDAGAAANLGEYGGCNADCTRAPYCGDRIVQDGETCDDGPTGSLACSTRCEPRVTIR